MAVPGYQLTILLQVLGWCWVVGAGIMVVGYKMEGAGTMVGACIMVVAGMMVGTCMSK